MKLNIGWTGVILLLLLAPKLGAELVIENAYMRELPPGAPVSAVFLRLRNIDDQPHTLLGVSSELASRAEIHSHKHSAGQMQMRPVDEVRVPGNSEIEFKPGGYHIMLFGLQRELKVGDSLPLVLEFANGRHISLTAEVRKR